MYCYLKRQFHYLQKLFHQVSVSVDNDPNMRTDEKKIVGSSCKYHSGETFSTTHLMDKEEFIFTAVRLSGS